MLSDSCSCFCEGTSFYLLEVSVFVFSIGLQDDGDGSHERFDHTELQRGLFTEPQEADGVGFSPQTAGTIHTAGPDGTPRKRQVL